MYKTRLKPLKSERKHSPAEIRAYWKGYGAGLTGLDSFTSKNANLLLDPYYLGRDNGALRMSVLRGLLDGQLARRKKMKSKRK